MSYSTIAQVRQVSGLAITDVSDADVTSSIAFADEEIERKTNRKYSSGNAVTEFYNVYPPKRIDQLSQNRILLDNYPVQSITSFTLVDSTGSPYSTLANIANAAILAGSWQTADYFVNPNNGLIELNSKVFDMVPKRAKISYTYGYASAPTIVSELSACLSGIKIWVEFLGGQYNRLNSYSLPEQSYNKGDFFDRGQKMIEKLSSRADNIFNQIGIKQRTQLFATSGGFF